jgi:hypothetical protein
MYYCFRLRTVAQFCRVRVGSKRHEPLESLLLQALTSEINVIPNSLNDEKVRSDSVGSPELHKL